MHFDAVRVSEIIHGVVSTIEPTLNGGAVRIIQDVASNLPELKTDREKLRQVILNLLDNAAKFTERGEIKIAASQQNGSLKLVVTDTGIGIDSDELRVIFEEFHRGRLSAGNNYRGTGLGLSIAKQLVNLLGGAIRVESEPGKGSTFTVLIPLNSEKRVHH
jgi:signal transduction histidine kinase